MVEYRIYKETDKLEVLIFNSASCAKQEFNSLLEDKDVKAMLLLHSNYHDTIVTVLANNGTIVSDEYIDRLPISKTVMVKHVLSTKFGRFNYIAASKDFSGNNLKIRNAKNYTLLGLVEHLKDTYKINSKVIDNMEYWLAKDCVKPLYIENDLFSHDKVIRLKLMKV